MTEYLLKINQISKALHDADRVRYVLDDVNFEIHSCEIVGIVGRSGIGKTTLLNLISGEVVADKGSIDWNDKTAHTRPRTSMIFQDDALFPWMCVRDNVVFSSAIRLGWTPKVIEAGEAYLRQLGLAGYEKVWPRQLSGGMRKRVELARAMHSKAVVLLLDEAFGMLDPITRHEVHHWFLDEAERTRLSGVIVTHDLEEAALLCNRIIWLDGRPASVKQIISGARGRSQNEVRRVRDEIELMLRSSDVF